MNTINMPGFAAEALLYRTSNHYFTAGGGFVSDGNTTVTPQGCRWLNGILCGTAIVAGTALCLDACLAGPLACGLC